MARPFKICPDCGAHLDASEPCDCKDAIEREPPKPWERLKLLAVCREVDKESGRVSVYPLDLEITSEILSSLKMRAQFNPELRYFTTTTARWDRYGEVMIPSKVDIFPVDLYPRMPFPGFLLPRHADFTVAAIRPLTVARVFRCAELPKV